MVLSHSNNNIAILLFMEEQTRMKHTTGRCSVVGYLWLFIWNIHELCYASLTSFGCLALHVLLMNTVHLRSLLFLPWTASAPQGPPTALLMPSSPTQSWSTPCYFSTVILLDLGFFPPVLRFASSHYFFLSFCKETEVQKHEAVAVTIISCSARWFFSKYDIFWTCKSKKDETPGLQKWEDHLYVVTSDKAMECFVWVLYRSQYWFKKLEKGVKVMDCLNRCQSSSCTAAICSLADKFACHKAKLFWDSGSRKALSCFLSGSAMVKWHFRDASSGILWHPRVLGIIVLSTSECWPTEGWS